MPVSMFLDFLVSIASVIIFNILRRMLKFSGKKDKFALLLVETNPHESGKMMPIRKDPDPQHWFVNSNAKTS